MRKGFRWLLVLILLLPVAGLLYLSGVKGWVYPDVWDADFTWEHWLGWATSPVALGDSLRLSLLMAISIAVTATLAGFFFSAFLLLSPGRAAWIKLSFFPYLIAPVSFGALLQYYFVRLGLSGSIAGVWIAQWLFVVPYANVLLSTFWNTRIRRLYQQALVLGASRRQAFFQIILPLAKPWLLLSLVQCFLISWYEYGITRIVGIGKVQTLTVGVMQFVQEANPHLAALSALLMVMPVIFLAALGYFMVGRISLQV